MFISDISKLKFRHTFCKCFLNSFLANIPFLYPLKTPENESGGGRGGGIKWEHWPEIG